MSRQKAKGSGYEREIAKRLTESFSDGEFYRTPGSGAYTGGKNKHRELGMDERMRQVFNGDVIPPDGYQAVIECKNYALDSFKGGFHSVMRGESSMLDNWIGRLIEDATDENGITIFHILFFKITRCGDFAVVPCDSNLGRLLYETVRYPYTVYHHGEDRRCYFIVDAGYIDTDSEVAEALKRDFKMDS